MAVDGFCNGRHALGNCELTGGQKGFMCHAQPIELGIGGFLSFLIPLLPAPYVERSVIRAAGQRAGALARVLFLC